MGIGEINVCVGMDPNFNLFYYVLCQFTHSSRYVFRSYFDFIDRPVEKKLTQSTKNKKTDWCEISILICQRCIGFAAYSQQHVQLNHQNFPSHFIRSSMCAHGYLKWNEIHVISDLSAKREKGKKNTTHTFAYNEQAMNLKSSRYVYKACCGLKFDFRFKKKKNAKNFCANTKFFIVNFSIFSLIDESVLCISNTSFSRQRVWIESNWMKIKQ